MCLVQFPQYTKLAERVMSGDAAALDLIELAVRANRIGGFG